jgi:hypothetical protein
VKTRVPIRWPTRQNVGSASASACVHVCRLHCTRRQECATGDNVYRHRSYYMVMHTVWFNTVVYIRDWCVTAGTSATHALAAGGCVNPSNGQVYAVGTNFTVPHSNVTTNITYLSVDLGAVYMCTLLGTSNYVSTLWGTSKQARTHTRARVNRLQTDHWSICAAEYKGDNQQCRLSVRANRRRMLFG